MQHAERVHRVQRVQRVQRMQRVQRAQPGSSAVRVWLREETLWGDMPRSQQKVPIQCRLPGAMNWQRVLTECLP